MSLDIRDQRMLNIVDEHAQRETIADTFNFTEGPIWHPTEHHLIFSDIPENKLYKWQAQAGLSIYREPSQMANGNTYDRQGRILTCEHATSRVVRQDSQELTVLAQDFEGTTLNSPNDIVVSKDGTIYFTDPTYGRQGSHGVERELELDFRGVYSISTSGQMTLLSKDFNQPNGLCLSLDEQSLFVADTPERHVRKFNIGENTLTSGDIFCSSPAPDGLKIDSLGNLYAGGPSGVGVYDGNDGSWLGNFATPEFCANFTWGGPDLSTLFMTASTCLFRIPVKVPGIALF